MLGSAVPWEGRGRERKREKELLCQHNPGASAPALPGPAATLFWKDPALGTMGPQTCVGPPSLGQDQQVWNRPFSPHPSSCRRASKAEGPLSSSRSCLHFTVGETEARRKNPAHLGPSYLPSAIDESRARVAENRGKLPASSTLSSESWGQSLISFTHLIFQPLGGW